jgi:hypothetical protein
VEQTGCTVAGDLLGRADVAAFVADRAAEPWVADGLDPRDLSDGLDAQTAFGLVEFVRRTGLGRPACGRALPCDQGCACGWYALTPSLAARTAHLEYRSRARGSLRRQLAAQLDRTGYYPAQLEELSCALALDGVSLRYEQLAELARGRRPPRTAAERLACNAVRLVGNMDAYAGRAVTPELLAHLYAELAEGSDGAAHSGALRPHRAASGTCCHFGADLVAEAALDPVAGHRLPFVLFCSHTAWERPLFERWSTTMELVVRALLLTVFDAPVLRYVPLALPCWRWQNAEHGQAGDYGRAVVETRYGPDHTALYARMLEFWEQGLNDLAAWVAERRCDDERCHGALETCRTLNHRQKALLGDMLDGGEQSVDAASYGARFNVVPSTAYADLNKLVDQGLLTVSSQGRTRRYRAAPDIGVRVANDRLLGGRRR